MADISCHSRCALNIIQSQVADVRVHLQVMLSYEYGMLL